MNINPKIAVVAVCGTLTFGLLGHVGYSRFADKPASMTASDLAASNARMKAQLQANLPEGIARVPQAAEPVPAVKPLAAGEMSGPLSDPAPTPLAILASRPATTANPSLVAAPVAVAAAMPPVQAGVPQERVSVLLENIMGKMQQETIRILSIGRSFDLMHADTNRM